MAEAGPAPAGGVTGWFRLQLRSPTAVVSSLALLLAAAVAVIWTVMPSEWSLVDDPGLRQWVMQEQHAYGAFLGLPHFAYDFWNYDHTWGLFRPLYYVYAATFYLLTPRLAHVVRILLFLVAVGLPALVATRQLTRSDARRPWFLAWIVALLATNAALYDGLYALSEQELTGCAAVALGLLAQRRMWLRSAAWTAAALFKAPFAWLGIAWGLLLLRRRETRLLGVADVVVGAVIVGAAGYYSRHGTYTAQYQFSLHGAVSALKSLWPYLRAPGLVGLLGLVALNVPLRALLPHERTAAALYLGGLGYMVNMLPWGTLGFYYSSPIVYMLSMGAVVSIAAAPGRPARHRLAWLRQYACLAGAVVAAAVVSVHMLTQEYTRNATIVAIRDWASGLPPSGVTIAINGPEYAIRLPQIMQLRDPSWRDNVVYPTAGAPVAGHVDYYVRIYDLPETTPTYETRPVAQFGRATVYAVGAR